MWFLHDGTGWALCSVAHGELAWLFLEPDTELDHCPRILLSCFRARISVGRLSGGEGGADVVVGLLTASVLRCVGTCIEKGDIEWHYCCETIAPMS